MLKKSHYCLIEAVKELYKKDKEILSLMEEFDEVRMSRHEIQYRGVFSDDEEAKYVLNLNKKLKKKTLNLLKD
ncbi:MAG TPA: HEPN domain-containing protein [Candidatus Nanoarchaeia archaeon]|nr:HEPN domain-containing protein [Candidatus Nanoarchaeia archaeon]